MPLLSILSNLRFQDALDILFLSVVTYHLFLWFRGTKAFKALVGLLVLGIIYTLANSWGLFLTTWVFQILWQVLIILIIILFQSEIRQVLERVNPIRTFGFRKIGKPEVWIPGFVKAIDMLTQRKLGALIIIEGFDLVDELVTEGQHLEAPPTPEMLLSIFQKDSPIHDGAVHIRAGQIKQVSCYLPLSSAEDLPREWGTRHRAALGLSERCDAWVLVVSEERNNVSVAHEGKMIRMDDKTEFVKLMLEATEPVSSLQKTWKDKIKFVTSHKWQAKLASLALVFSLWLLFAGQQNFEKTFQINLAVKNMPSNLLISSPLNPKLEITVEGLRKDASILSDKNVYAQIDLHEATFGNNVFTVSRDQIILPAKRVNIINIKPSQVLFEFVEKPVQ